MIIDSIFKSIVLDGKLVLQGGLLVSTDIHAGSVGPRTLIVDSCVNIDVLQVNTP